jgi:ribonucleoside-diphosphate reductase subunit M2
MTISSDGNFSVASLKEKFARAGRGKENATLIVGKKHVEEVEQKKVEEDEEEEPLLVENKKRFVLFPIKYHEVIVLPG